MPQFQLSDVVFVLVLLILMKRTSVINDLQRKSITISNNSKKASLSVKLMGGAYSPFLIVDTLVDSDVQLENPWAPRETDPSATRAPKSSNSARVHFLSSPFPIPSFICTAERQRTNNSPSLVQNCCNVTWFDKSIILLPHGLVSARSPVQRMPFLRKPFQARSETPLREMHRLEYAMYW